MPVGLGCISLAVSNPFVPPHSRGAKLADTFRSPRRFAGTSGKPSWEFLGKTGIPRNSRESREKSPGNFSHRKVSQGYGTSQISGKNRDSDRPGAGNPVSQFPAGGIPSFFPPFSAIPKISHRSRPKDDPSARTWSTVSRIGPLPMAEGWSSDPSSGPKDEFFGGFMIEGDPSTGTGLERPDDAPTLGTARIAAFLPHADLGNSGNSPSISPGGPGTQIPKIWETSPSGKSAWDLGLGFPRRKCPGRFPTWEK